jgi:hypothetical protein
MMGMIKLGWDEIESLKQENENLKCYMRTLYAYADIRKVCPNCKEYMLIDGYCCFGCGHDDGMEK